MTVSDDVRVHVDAVMGELQDRVRAQLREELLRHGASPVIADPAIFADVESMLRRAVTAGSALRGLLLPEILGDPTSWQIDPTLRYHSHRKTLSASIIRNIKRHLLMPWLRWFFEYGHNNFVRQRRINQVVFACIQELATQNAELRRELQRLKER